MTNLIKTLLVILAFCVALSIAIALADHRDTKDLLRRTQEAELQTRRLQDFFEYCTEMPVDLSIEQRGPNIRLQCLRGELQGNVTYITL